MVIPVDAGVGRDGRWTVDELTLGRILDECLEALDEGETDVAALAARYPPPPDSRRVLPPLRRRARGGTPTSLIPYPSPLWLRPCRPDGAAPFCPAPLDNWGCQPYNLDLPTQQTRLSRDGLDGKPKCRCMIRPRE